MTVVNPKSISGINSITTGSGSDNLLTIHTSDASSTERVRINSSGDVIVGSGITVSPDGDIFATGVCTATTFSGSLAASNLTGALPAISGANLTNLDASDLASGTVPTARLGSGTASSSTFLRGDSTFAAVTSTTINSNTDNYIITGTGTANELQGESELQWNGSNLFVRAGEAEAASLNLIADQGDDNGDGWKIQSEQDENDLTFKSNVSGSYVDKLKLKNSGQLEAQGNITLVSGANVVMANGQGISFAATSDASGMSSELLDDYEEGTWTPVVGGWDTFTPYSGSSYYYGWYIKVGKMIHVGWKIYYQALTTASSSNPHIRISGLPYNSNSTSAGPVGHVRFDIPEFGNTGYPLVYLAGNSDILYMYKHINNANNLEVINATSNYSNGWTMGTANYWTV